MILQSHCTSITNCPIVSNTRLRLQTPKQLLPPQQSARPPLFVCCSYSRSPNDGDDDRGWGNPALRNVPTDWSAPGANGQPSPNRGLREDSRVDPSSVSDAPRQNNSWNSALPFGWGSGWNARPGSPVPPEETGWGQAEPQDDWGGWRQRAATGGAQTGPSSSSAWQPGSQQGTTWETGSQPGTTWEPSRQPGPAPTSSWQPESTEPRASATNSAQQTSYIPNYEASYEHPGPTGQPADFIPSDIVILSERDKDEILPVTPTGRQAQFYSPKTLPERTVQVAGALAGVVVFSKTTVLAVPALLYPLWGPWARAGLRNFEVMWTSFRFTGLWRAQVLDVEVVQSVPYSAFSSQNGAGDGPCVRMVLGDPWRGGARTQLVFPYAPGCEDVVTGEPAELLVLSNDPSFVQFKVIREVYLPQTGIWLAEYPFLNRDMFLDISLEVERARQRGDGAPAATGGLPPTYDVSSDNFAMR